MRKCIFTQSGIAVEVIMVRGKSDYWLAIAQWDDGQGQQTTRAMLPQESTLPEDVALREARAWASRRLTQEQLVARGVDPKLLFSMPIEYSVIYPDC